MAFIQARRVIEKYNKKEIDGTVGPLSVYVHIDIHQTP
jgi:hypothetical protein